MKGRRIASAFTAASLLAIGGCSSYSNNFENRPGDIYAGQPSVVKNHWYSEKHATNIRGVNLPASGYLLYLWSEDCPPGKEPTPGLKEVTPGCSENATNVDIATYTNFHDGSGIVWEKPFPWEQEKHGIVEGHSYQFGQGKIAYSFAFLVEQCGVVATNNPSGSCVQDFVEVSADTYFASPDNTTLVWPGDKGTIVSQR